ncbi:MAG: hypothetical protein LBV71_16115 [Prevotella sp.]|jgi:hypothetical protein|nr:hypothetical protein [Prevotella sp.]
MAIDLTTTTYQPKRELDFFTKLMFNNKTSEHVRIIPNVKYETLLNISDITDDLLQFDGAGVDCGWTPSGDVKFSERVLKVVPFKINFEQCLKDFEGTWLGEAMKPGANLGEMPIEANEQIVFLLGKKIGKEIENKVWNAVASATSNDGFLNILATATDTNAVAGVSLTKANVLGEMEKVYLAQTADVIGGSQEGNLKFYVGTLTSQIIRLALGDASNQTIASNWVADANGLKYMGYDVVALNAIPANTIVFANQTNLAYGTDLISDETELKIGMFPEPNEDMYFAKGRLKLGVQVGFPDEVVYYHS